MKMKSRYLFLALVVGCAMIGTTAVAQTFTLYNSIPNPLPGNVASEGPENYAFSELGDAIKLGENTGTIGKVTVILSSWACQNGNWHSGNCVSTPGANFRQPLTVKLYSVSNRWTPPEVVSFLGSITETSNIPYRPTSTPALCGGDTSEWYSSKDKACYRGLAAPVAVDFSSLHIQVPAYGELAVTVAFDTTHYGPYPIGESAACFGTSAGCPYDFLNIATDSSKGILVGGPLDNLGVFVNYTLPNHACDPATITTGQLVDDKGCWDGYHPEISIIGNTNVTHHSRPLAP
jgi:hypothetical protein